MRAELRSQYWQQVRLYVLIDGQLEPNLFTRRAAALVDVGVHALQLRDKELPDRRLLERARQLRQLTADSETLFFVNDRPDIALLSQADGLHVGQDELAVADVRKIIDSQMLVGVSTHTLQQAQQAQAEGADYIGCGPVFASPTKTFPRLAGLELLRQVGGQITIPALAIGGICRSNLRQVLAAGWNRIAVSSAVWQAPDPAAEARALLAMLTRCSE